jgi:hypothetical protein
MVRLYTRSFGDSRNAHDGAQGEQHKEAVPHGESCTVRAAADAGKDAMRRNKNERSVCKRQRMLSMPRCQNHAAQLRLVVVVVVVKVWGCCLGEGAAVLRPLRKYCRGRRAER